MIGSMHWTPSRSAAERLITRIWPLVKKRVPRAKLFIAGWNARKHLGKYLPMPDVTLEDGVPHPTDFFSKAAVMVYAPSRGSGMKIKVLESMAYGVPVVTTWEGVEGVDYENGTHCWVAEEDEAIAERAAALLEDRGQRQLMREAARSLMEERYSPEPVMGRMLQVYDEVLGKQ
jgi:glycosyltransferase involved in cell wall biosynthesis